LPFRLLEIKFKERKQQLDSHSSNQGIPSRFLEIFPRSTPSKGLIDLSGPLAPAVENLAFAQIKAKLTCLGAPSLNCIAPPLHFFVTELLLQPRIQYVINKHIGNFKISPYRVHMIHTTVHISFSSRSFKNAYINIPASLSTANSFKVHWSLLTLNQCLAL
jgi:hypothetical protein